MADWYEAKGSCVHSINCREPWLVRAWPALLAFHPNKDTWYRRRWERGLFSPSAWDRHTRLNGRLLDKVLKPGAKILQMAKEYFPHPRYQEMEYFLFINYNARLSRSDGYTPWRPAPQNESEFIEKEDLLFQHAAHVFTAGEYLRRNLMEESGVRPDRVTSVGNGVNPLYLKNSPQKLPKNFFFRLLFVGWDFGLKGGVDLLESLPMIWEKYPQVELLVVGPDENQRQKMGSIALAKGVRWLGPERVKIEHFRSSDLLVLPSLRDSYGFVFLEAMSQGLPCVGTDINGMPEMIVPEETGYIVPRHSPGNIAEAVCRYYDNPENKLRMAMASIQRIHKFFTWDVVMSKVNAAMGMDV